MNHLKIISKWALPSAKFAYKMLAVSAEVFCRHSFGRRYTTNLLTGFFCCFIFLSLFRMGVPQLYPVLLDIYLLIYFFLVLYHLGQMWCQRQTVHSHSSGKSWEYWAQHNVNSHLVKILIEPLIHVLVGLSLMAANGLLSAWLMLAGVCLFIKEVLAYWQFGNRVLDSVDARLEGERIGTGVRQQTAPQGRRENRANPVVAAEPAQPPANTLQQIYTRLDPALQQLVATPNQNPPAATVPNRPAGPLVVIRRQGQMPGPRPSIGATQPPGIPSRPGSNVPPLVHRPNPIPPKNRT